MLHKLLVALALTLMSSTLSLAQSSLLCDEFVDTITGDISSNETGAIGSASDAYQAEDYERATDILDELIQESQENAEAYLLSGCSHFQLGNVEDAYDDLLVYVSLAPAEAARTKATVNPIAIVNNLELTQTKTIELPDFDGTLTINIPDGWVTQDEDGVVLIANNEEVIEIENPAVLGEIPTGSVLISLTIIPADLAGALGLDEDATPADILELFSSFLDGEDMPAFGEIEELTIDGNPAALLSGSDDVMHATMYTISKGDAFAFGFGATRADEADEYTDVIQAIIASTTFTTDN